MKQPPGYMKVEESHKVCKLQKSIYGLKQSGRVWNNEFNDILNSIDFVKLRYCNCVYMYKNEIVLACYVDDCIMFGKDSNSLDCMFNKLKSVIDVVNLGKVKYLLGVNFEFEGKNVYLHQQTYINKLEAKFEELPKSHVILPFIVGTVLHKAESKEVETELMEKYPYRSLIGCLSFIADRSRPDISFSVNVMSQFCNNYTYQNWLNVVNIANYVFNTSDHRINLSCIKNCNLEAYSDASWGSSLTNRHSISGYVIFIDNVPIAWKASKQKCVALSSMESEFIALTESVKELLWFQNVLKELDLSEIYIPLQYCDNQSAIFFCRNCVENAKTKHIDIRLQFIRELLSAKNFELKFVSSRTNPADLFTKAHPKDRLELLKKSLHIEGPDVGLNRRGDMQIRKYDAANHGSSKSYKELRRRKGAEQTEIPLSASRRTDGKERRNNPRIKWLTAK